MKFDTPMIWRQPFCHLNDCYFCLSKKVGFGKHLRWMYANVASVIFPVPHTADAAHPQCPGFTFAAEESSQTMTNSSESDFEPTKKTKLLSQQQLNDWVRDLELSKDKSELLASRMQEHGFLAAGVKTTVYRNRHEPYAKYFTKKNQICYCNDVPGLFKELNLHHNSNEWRLFIDSSKDSLKAVLLHNGNKKPSIPIAHAVNVKETYEIIAELLEYINYKNHQWKVCSDLKVVAILCGMQAGYTKYCCFLCLWDSRATDLHYEKNKWLARTSTVVGEANIKYSPIVERKNILLPPLHIKLGLAKNFVKKLDKEGKAFGHLRSVFTHLSYAKLKEGVLAGPEIKQLIKDTHFVDFMSPVEAAAWNSFKMVVENFLGNKKSPDYKTIVNDLLKNYKAMSRHY